MPLPRIYKMDRSLRDTRSNLSEFPNQYSVLLLEIAQSLTAEDFSSIKLMLQTNKILTVKELERLDNPQDLLRFLDTRSVICKEDVSFMGEILQAIRRMDLKRKLESYSCTIETCTSNLLFKQPHDQENKQIADSYVKYPETDVDGDSDTIMFTKIKSYAAAHDGDDSMPSSQESITDEEKMMLLE